ncbi:hypothetical protein Lal_00038799 [Lupinus albus]|nr:hypothetical protein Lal_00038799 [Lupinus albus]
MRWMYTFESYMTTLKGYAKNRSRPYSCIVERYIVEETLDFCIGYLADGDFIEPYVERHKKMLRMYNSSKNENWISK